MKKDLLSIKNLTSADIAALFKQTDSLKKRKDAFSRTLTGKTLGLIFQKPSNRTRVSFEVGMYQLGGNSLYLAPHEINLGVRESIADVAKTLSRYIDAIVLRTFEHKNVIEMARHATVPVINGLSDFSHPCQALADIYTMQEKFKKIKGLTLAYVGDGNNVCNSLLLTCAKTGVHMRVGAPKGFTPDVEVVKQAALEAKHNSCTSYITHDPGEAVKGADVVYTDVWTSMGQEKEAQERKTIFKDFQINAALMAKAKKNALVMHCLPAHRGEEITDEVIDGKHSIVFDQAENRMHVQKAILIKLLK
ncbi:MAG: ornithine carbamoyltransferase [Candidatus Omnitrophica bacterium]|nr:ornithine carbamoyltransferase [Candidatus Omnitrophota bacterium]